MAFVGFALFLRVQMHRRTVEDGNVYASDLFFTVIAIMFNGMVEIVLIIEKLGVFYKQRDLLFYPPWAFALPTWILRIPITVVEVALWVAIDRKNMDRQYIKHCPGLSYLFTCNL